MGSTSSKCTASPSLGSLSYDRRAVSSGDKKSSSKKLNKSSLHRPGSFHEKLIRQRDREHDFDDIYEVCNEIGHGGLCKIFKVRKYDDKIGGSSRPEGVRTRQSRLKTRLSKLNGSMNSKSTRDLMSALRQQSEGVRVDFDEGMEIPRPSRLSAEKRSVTAPESLPSRSGMFFALKVINLALVKEDQIDQLKNEVEILKTLDHKNIIKAYETFQMKKLKKLMIIMELCSGGDMYARMPYTEKEVGRAMRQVLSAIHYMHSKRIIHRDIKLENILWESDHPEAVIKVIDFGLSKQYSPNNNILTERVGTLYSMSPETMRGIYTTQADLWSIGVCTFIMLTNGHGKPFEGQTPKQLVANVLQCNYKFETVAQDDAGTGVNLWDNISDDAKSFISELLVLAPEKRLVADQAKNHEWLSYCTQGWNAAMSVRYENLVPQIFHAETPPLDEDENDYDESEDGDQYASHDLPAAKKRSFSAKFVSEEFKDRVRANLIEYADMGEFRRLALNVIAKKSTSDEIFEIRKVFDEFDTLNTGTITLEEFKAALAQFEYSEEEVMKIFHKIDVNKSNVINYTEFLAATLETQGAIAEYRLAEAFDQLDCDDSGYISRENLRSLLGKKADDRYIETLMAEADFKKDGRISYEEFLQVFSTHTREDIQCLYEKGGSWEMELKADQVLQEHGFKTKVKPSSPPIENKSKTAPVSPASQKRRQRQNFLSSLSSSNLDGA